MIGSARGLGSLALALGVAAAGGYLAQALGLPAGLLIGATVAVALLAALGAAPSLPDRLRDVAFAALGMTLGAGATPQIAEEIARWPLAIAVLPVALAAMSLAAFAVVVALSRLRGSTAALAVSPGALSYALALASDREMDVRPIMVMQSLRLFLVTVALPPLVALFDDARFASLGPSNVAIAPMGLLTSTVLLAFSLAAGWLAQRLRLPAAWLFGGLAVSFCAHVLGFVEGRPHPILVACAFLVIGALVGGRFGSIGRREIVELLPVGLWATLAAILVAALFAWPVSVALALPFGQVWVAYAPGGVEAMAAIGLALDYDPVFVALHHVVRLLILAVALPLVMNLLVSRD